MDALHKLLLLPGHWKKKTLTMRISTIPCSGCPTQAPSAARTLEEEDTHHENKHYSMQWTPFTSSFCCQNTGRRRHSPWEWTLFHAVDALHKLFLLPEHWKKKTLTMRISTIPCSGCPSQALSAARTLEEDTHHENKHYSMQWMPFTSSFCCQDTRRRRHSPWEH